MRQRESKPEYFVVHHSASNDLGVGINTLKAERMRRNEGYNVIIDLNEETGKAEFSQDVPDDYISNGVYGVNSRALNICVNGNFEDRHPTEAELKCLEQVLVAKLKKYGYTKSSVGRIVGHEYAGKNLSAEYYVTACPGRFMIALLPALRARVAKYLP